MRHHRDLNTTHLNHILMHRVKHLIPQLEESPKVLNRAVRFNTVGPIIGPESFGKMDKIQAFKTSGILGMVAMVLLLGALVLWPWQLDNRSAELVRAKQKAEIVAYQIVQIYKEAQFDEPADQPVAQKRGMASVKPQGQSSVQAGGVLREFKNQGIMSRDPWGQPYQYRIVNLETGPRLVVWSTGPNKILDNPDFQSADPHEALSLPKAGDDIRVVLAINSDSK